MSTLGERTPNDAANDPNQTPQPGQVYHEDTTEGSEITFHRGAVSSTPQAQKFSHVADSIERSIDTNESWVARSVESPFERFDRQLKDLALDEDQDTQSSIQPQPTQSTSGAPRGGKPIPLPQFESEESSTSIPSISAQQRSTSSSVIFAVPESPQEARTAPSPNKGKSRRKSAGRDLRQEVLKSNLMNTAKPGVRWNGITDLRSNVTFSDSTVSTSTNESFGEVTQREHITLQPYSPSRNRETLQRTPSKQAAAMLVRNVLSKVPSGSDLSATPADTSAVSSVAPSTSATTRNYGAAPSSTSSGSTLGRKPNPIQGLFGLSPEDLQGSGLLGKSNPPPASQQTSGVAGPSRQVYAEESPFKWQDDLGSVSPAEYRIPRTIDIGDDESFDRSRSTDSSFDNDESRYGEEYEQPRWLSEETDRYSSGGRGPQDEETIFGARRASAAPAQATAATGTRPSNLFALPDVTETYFGGRLEDAAGEESPTPWARSAPGRGR